MFRHLHGLEFPYEFGRGRPIAGDVIERDGLHTRYMQVDLKFDVFLADKMIIAYNDETASLVVLGCAPQTLVSPYTYWTSLHHRVFFQDREEIGTLRDPFEYGGKRRVWYNEIIRDIDDSGATCSWMATICGTEARPTLWTPRFRSRSERYERTTKAANAAAARARECGVAIQVDRIDPHDIFERDGWICRLCGGPVDRAQQHPQQDSPSLDHVCPISRGGDHTAANLQTSHLRCNIAKGDRVDRVF